MVQKISLPEYDFLYIQTDKFTQSLFGILFLETLSKEQLAEKELLARLMVKSTKTCPSEKDFSNHLKELYDISLTSGLNIFGRTSVFNVKASFINENYVYDKTNLFESVVETIRDTILKPGFLVYNDSMIKEVDEKKFKREKSLLLDAIKSLYNNKVSYAIKELRSKMYENEDYGMAFESLEPNVEKSTKESLLETYEHLLKLNKLIFYVGNLAFDDVLQVVKQKFVFNQPSPKEQLVFINKNSNQTITEKEIIVPKNITQSVLAIGYRSEIVVDEELFEACNIFSYMLGGFFNSSLFQVIREEHSLAYYIASLYDARDGDIIIYGGINKKNYAKTLHLIMNIIGKYQQGDFTEEDEERLEMAKMSLAKTIYESEDEINGVLSKILNHVFGQRQYTNEEKIARINQVTLDDVQIAAQKLQLDTIYLLQGEMNNE